VYWGHRRGELGPGCLLAPDIASGIARAKRRAPARRAHRQLVDGAAGRSTFERTGHADAQRQRDHALLAIMLGCGIRREETASLKARAHPAARRPLGDRRRRDRQKLRVRSVPMPSWAKAVQFFPAIGTYGIPPT
jgi:hypothetical protein